MPSNPRRLCSLTILQKLRIVEEQSRRQREAGDCSQQALALWAQNKLWLLRPPSQPVMSRILSQGPTHLKATSRIAKRFKGAESPQLESALLSWVNNQVARRVCINGELIKLKAQKLQHEINAHLPESRQLKGKFSNGWLYNFQRRHSLKSLTSHGESGDADDTAIANSLPKLLELLKSYKPEDTFNADEFGHCYAITPDHTIAAQRMPGRKKDKRRLTYLTCCNATGNERLPLMIIGKSKKPRCFNRKSGQELGFDYHSNTKAWMTSSLFFDWYLRLSSYVARTNSSRKILLLLDNCSAHRSVEYLPAVENIDVCFLPPRTTSKLQPLDAGVIAVLKARYRSWQYKYALDRMEAGYSEIYAMDQLSSMRQVRNIWEELSATIIANCWKRTGLLVCSNSLEIVPRTEEQDIHASLSRLLSAGQFQRIDVINLLNPSEEEDDCFEAVDETFLCLNAANDILRREERSEEEHEFSIYDNMDFREQLKAAVAARHLLSHYEIRDGPAEKALLELQRLIKRAQTCSQKQTTLHAFFK